MSQAYKCDRCGCLYDEQVKSSKRNVIVRPINRTLDLCPECQEQLDDWIIKNGTFIRNRYYNQNDKQKCCSNCKFGDIDNAPICDICTCGNSNWEPKEDQNDI